MVGLPASRQCEQARPGCPGALGCWSAAPLGSAALVLDTPAATPTKMEEMGAVRESCNFLLIAFLN